LFYLGYSNFLFKELQIIWVFDLSINVMFVEASFMMMNQVDSRSFDDDKKPKRMISRLSQQVQDQD